MGMITAQQVIFASVWIFELLSTSTHGYRFEPNTFTFNNYSECRGESKNVVHVNYTITPFGRNKYMVNGEAVFDESLAGQLEVRCYLNDTPST